MGQETSISTVDYDKECQSLLNEGYEIALYNKTTKTGTLYQFTGKHEHLEPKKKNDGLIIKHYRDDCQCLFLGQTDKYMLFIFTYPMTITENDLSNLKIRFGLTDRLQKITSYRGLLDEGFETLVYDKSTKTTTSYMFSEITTIKPKGFNTVGSIIHEYRDGCQTIFLGQNNTELVFIFSPHVITEEESKTLKQKFKLK